jgi:hypothetical protein
MDKRLEVFGRAFDHSIGGADRRPTNGAMAVSAAIVRQAFLTRN